MTENFLSSIAKLGRSLKRRRLHTGSALYPTRSVRTDWLLVLLVGLLASAATLALASSEFLRVLSASEPISIEEDPGKVVTIDRELLSQTVETFRNRERSLVEFLENPVSFPDPSR